MSAVQSYVPTEKRGRVNGIFLIMTTVGMLMGRLLSGYLGELFDYQYIVLAMNCISLLAFVFIVFPLPKLITKCFCKVPLNIW